MNPAMTNEIPFMIPNAECILILLIHSMKNLAEDFGQIWRVNL